MSKVKSDHYNSMKTCDNIWMGIFYFFVLAIVKDVY